jgi:hypothetical protein
MLKNLRLNKILWLVATGLTIIAAVYGLLNNDIYVGLMPAGFVAAQYTQDILTILVCLLLLFLIYKTNDKSTKTPVVIIGILGSLAYLYAIFSIERVYNVMYLFYLAILGVTFYAALYTISSLRPEVIAKMDAPKAVRNTTATFSMLIGVLFTAMWIGALLPLMRTGDQIDNLYSIYVLDLVFIMPTFIILAVMTFLRKPLGYVLTPAMFILGIFVIFPLGLGELAKLLPRFDLTPDFKSMTMSFVLTCLFILGSAVQIRALKQKNK